MLQPPPKPTAEELKANAERAHRHNRNCVALELFAALLIRDRHMAKEKLLDESFEWAERFIKKGEE